MSIHAVSPAPAQRKVVLITGASSGIGEATARHLASMGHQAVLGARRTDRITVIAQEIRQAGGRVIVEAATTKPGDPLLYYTGQYGTFAAI